MITYNFWNGKFEKPVTKQHKISLCITCMGRLEDLRQTLPENIKNNAAYEPLEFVILDYNSNDGLGSWVQDELGEYLDTGKVVHYRTEEPQFFSMAHSRNLAFKLANGDIVNNLDADNYTWADKPQTEPCFAAYLNKLANECGPHTIFAKGKRMLRGRVGFWKWEFIHLLGGYDEGLSGYGHDDHDLVQRAWGIGFKMAWFGGAYYRAIKTAKKKSTANMEDKNWKHTENENKRISQENVDAEMFVANQGQHWGKGIIVKNFKEEIIL